MEEPIINEHNKQEFPPAHTAEHILNGTMVKMFGCRRAKTAHVERKKSKLDYDFPRALTPVPAYIRQAQTPRRRTVRYPIKRNRSAPSET